MAANLSKYSDNELLLMFRQGDELAGGQLAERYRPLVKRCTRPFFLVGGSEEDLVQEGMIGLVCSMQGYELDGAASFKSYAELCIRRRIMDAVRAASRNKHMPLNQRLSLDEIYSEEGEAERLIGDELYKLSPEELILEQEKKNSFYALCRQLLSPLEKKGAQLLSGRPLLRGDSRPMRQAHKVCGLSPAEDKEKAGSKNEVKFCSKSPLKFFRFLVIIFA